MTTTKELIDRLEIISRVETDLYWLTAQRMRELDIENKQLNRNRPLRCHSQSDN